MTSTAATTNSVLPNQNTTTSLPEANVTSIATTTTTTEPTASSHHNNNQHHHPPNNNNNNVRKASNASTISSHRSITTNTSRSSTSKTPSHASLSLPLTAAPTMNTTTLHSNSCSSTSSNHHTHNNSSNHYNNTSSCISDRRLPRKKRKESNEDDNEPEIMITSQHDETLIPSSSMEERRKHSQDLSTATSTHSLFPDLGLRKDAVLPETTSSTHHNNNNTDLTLLLHDTSHGSIRKSSQDTTTNHSLSITSLGLPSLDSTEFLVGVNTSTSTTTITTKVHPPAAPPSHSSSTGGAGRMLDHPPRTKGTKRDRSETLHALSTSQHSLVPTTFTHEHIKVTTTGSTQPVATAAAPQHHTHPTLSTTATVASIDDHHPLPLKTGHDDNSSQDETFASSGHRVLMEAIMLSGVGSNSTTTVPGGVLTGVGAGSNSSKTLLEPVHSSLSIAGGNVNTNKNVNFPYRERLDSTASSFRYNMFNGRRDRLESWGGMSDLSVGPNASDSVIATAVAAATNLHNGLLFEDPDHDDIGVGQLPALRMSASFSHDDPKLNSTIPSKISVPPYRDRLGSIASLGDLSVSNMNNNLTIDGIDVPGSDLQAFVAAAMASVGDQLIEFAGAMEELTGESMTSDDLHREFTLNDGADCSVASPMIGAVSDVVGGVRRPRAWSTSSRLPVDIEAVNAAVEAAYSVGMVPAAEQPDKVKSNSNTTKKRTTRIVKRPLPTKKTRNEINTSSSQSTTSEHRQSDVAAKGKSSKKRPRKSEVSTAETIKKGTPKSMVPLKKRPLEKILKSSKSATPSSENAIAAMKTPIVSNRTMVEPVISELNITPSMVLSMSSDCNNSSSKNCGGDGGASGQANQKWEKMFECMMEFAEERKVEDTKDMTEEEKNAWIWDGNVPTNYKSKDGMALGRWVNNQRSAKAKGTLKDDREQRLIGAGLKWSVLASNSWNEMLQELSIYIKDQHRQGKVWDGNVPTNYQIKSRPDGGFNGEDKNLGRWVNRQRSLYQSGKLRKERKILLEGVGLKWSMLATTSWDGMYDTLKEYAEQQVKKLGGEKWDGNVPANYRTSDNPPRALGRWVNRQRSAFAKKKLKNEFVDKLNVLGLKWSVHHRPGEMDDNDDGEFGDEFEDPIDTVTPDPCDSAGGTVELVAHHDENATAGTSTNEATITDAAV